MDCNWKDYRWVFAGGLGPVGRKQTRLIISEKADTKKCVKELALPWTIIDNAQSEATEIYGVSGIPHIIVFAPDGTILARDLRGNDLAAKVDELLAK